MTVSAVDILNEQLPDGYVAVNAVVIIAALDPETGDEHLIHRRDDDASVWKHIGMMQVVLDGYRYDCQDVDD